MAQHKAQKKQLAAAIDGVRLRQDLTAIARDKDLNEGEIRQRALECLRAAQEAGRDYARRQLDKRVPGRAVAQIIAHVQDVVIQALYDFTTIHIYRSRNPTEAERLSLVAVGGYGRGDLAPGSDIDLLFVLPYKQTPWGESVVEYMLYMLWDLGLKVGHATRTVRQCVELSKSDMTIRTALLEMRYLWGDRPLFDELKAAYWRDVVPGTDREFVEAKMAERARRHERAGESRYLVEPNIKESKGGLRDLQTLFWIAKYLYRLESGEGLVDAGLLTRQELNTFRKSYSFLWSVRCHLHFMTGRAEERLTFDVQPEIARRTGYADRAGQPAVERFMKHYFLVAKDIGDLTRIFCTVLEARHRKSRPRLGRFLRFGRTRRALPEGFVLDGGRLSVAGPEVFQKDPVNLLRLFHVADDKSLLIHPEALKLAKRSRALINRDLRHNPEANRLFLEVMTSRRDPERALRRMSEAGVLGRFIPDFGRVEAMMQFNMYHHYTVDEHTIRAIGLLSQIERGELGEDHPLANEIIHKVLNRKVLYLAVFLHDIAKGRKEDHSDVGARIARRLCPRLGFSSAETETVAWLVQNHLVMSEFAQSRDISDPKTIEAFSRIVQSPERLRLLLVLTVADIRAVGPGVWNGWKGQLLRELYFETENLLQGGTGGRAAPRRAARIAAAKEALIAAIASWPPEEAEAALTRHTDSYWLSFDEAAHLRYARFMRDADGTGARVSLCHQIDRFKSITEIVVYTADQPGLFSKLAGALALSGATIKDAKVFTTSDGRALDVFYVQSATGAPFDEPSRFKALERTITSVLDGDLVPHEQMSRPKLRRREKAFSVEPQVLIDNQASDIHTLIEVSGRDRPGLLYDLTRALSELRLSIASAHISTYGERAVDVFYVKDRAGFKITAPAALAGIEKTLLAALDLDYADTARAAE